MYLQHVAVGECVLGIREPFFSNNWYYERLVRKTTCASFKRCPSALRDALKKLTDVEIDGAYVFVMVRERKDQNRGFGRTRSPVIQKCTLLHRSCQANCID